MSTSGFQPLTLGTVQLGLPYGIANSTGQPDLEQARQILETAGRCGFGYLDTAAAYGTSETVIGSLRRTVDPENKLKLISKIPVDLPLDEWPRQLQSSLEKLRCSYLDGWLLHHERDFPRLKPDALAIIAEARRAGLVKSFGVSCYNVEIAMAALKIPEVTMLQVPANVFDRRFLSDELLALLRDRQGFLTVRSVFLQGVCLMKPGEVPARVPGGQEAVRVLHEFCQVHDLTPQAFSLHYLNHRLRDTAHSLIVGVETVMQLAELVRCIESPAPDEAVFAAWEERSPQSPIELVNTLLWRPA